MTSFCIIVKPSRDAEASEVSNELLFLSPHWSAVCVISHWLGGHGMEMGYQRREEGQAGLYRV